MMLQLFDKLLYYLGLCRYKAYLIEYDWGQETLKTSQARQQEIVKQKLLIDELYYELDSKKYLINALEKQLPIYDEVCKLTKDRHSYIPLPAFKASVEEMQSVAALDCALISFSIFPKQQHYNLDRRNFFKKQPYLFDLMCRTLAEKYVNDCMQQLKQAFKEYDNETA